MPLYEYVCAKGHRTERLRDAEDRNEPCLCDQCGQPALPVLSPVNHSFGWRLTEKSHIKGNRDEFERDV